MTASPKGGKKGQPPRGNNVGIMGIFVNKKKEF